MLMNILIDMAKYPSKYNYTIEYSDFTLVNFTNNNLIKKNHLIFFYDVFNFDYQIYENAFNDIFLMSLNMILPKSENRYERYLDIISILYNNRTTDYSWDIYTKNHLTNNCFFRFGQGTFDAAFDNKTLGISALNEYSFCINAIRPISLSEIIDIDLRNFSKNKLFKQYQLIYPQWENSDIKGFHTVDSFNFDQKHNNNKQ
jgi:hypothetical protein